MEKIRLYYDTKGNTLNVWFDDPKKEHICEETGEEIILAKDRRGRVIGFEKLNYGAAITSKRIYQLLRTEGRSLIAVILSAASYPTRPSLWGGTVSRRECIKTIPVEVVVS